MCWLFVKKIENSVSKYTKTSQEGVSNNGGYEVTKKMKINNNSTLGMLVLIKSKNFNFKANYFDASDETCQKLSRFLKSIIESFWTLLYLTTKLRIEMPVAVSRIAVKVHWTWFDPLVIKLAVYQTVRVSDRVKAFNFMIANNR